jgi:L-ascorbate metabolism protein UlaG (beta-lactamase superfamily)
MDEIKICHLGDLGHSLTDKQMEKIDGIDILMIPVGGNFTISWDEADSVINQVEPRIVIPMHYHLPGLKIKLDPVDKFCKEMGVSAKETVSKISLKKKDLPQEKTEVMVMGLK